MKIYAKTLEVENKLFFLVGLTCTWNALIFGGVALYNYILLLWIIYHIIRHHTFLHLSDPKARFVNFLLISIVLSIAASVISLPEKWIVSSIKSLVKYIFVFSTIFWLLDNKRLKDAKNYFLRGFYYGAIVQMVWGYLQFILFFLKGIEFNTIIFGKILGIGEIGGTKIVWDSYVAAGGLTVLRMKGIGWEAANFSLTMVLGFILARSLKKSSIIKCLFVVSILLCTSRSGWVAFAAVIIAILFKKVLIANKNKEKRKKRYLEYLIILIFLATAVIILGEKIFTIIMGMLHNLRSSLDTSDARSSSSLHISYYTNLFKMLSGENIFNILLGNGYFSAGYIASMNIKAFSEGINNIGWNPESDFITLILGNGLLGCIGYYGFCIFGIIKHKLNDYALMIIAIVVMGITYLTIRGTWSLLIIAFSITAIQNKKTKQKKQAYNYEKES